VMRPRRSIIVFGVGARSVAKPRLRSAMSSATPATATCTPPNKDASMGQLPTTEADVDVSGAEMLTLLDIGNTDLDDDNVLAPEILITVRS